MTISLGNGQFELSGKSLVQRDDTTVHQLVFIAHSTIANPVAGGLCMLSEDMEPVAYSFIAANGQLRDASLAPVVKMGLGYLQWAAEYLDTLPAGPPTRHD